MEEKVAALRKMHAENLHHYDARCPRCGRANAISRERLEMFTPGWEEAIKTPAATPMTPEKPAVPGMAAPTLAPMAPAASPVKAAATKKAAPARKRHKPAAKKAAKKVAKKPAKKTAKKAVKKAKKTARKPAKKTAKSRKKR